MALLPVAAFVRFLSEADELQRVIQLQALALGFAAGFVLWPSIRLLERLGTPVSQWHTVLPMAIIVGYVVGIALNRRRFRGRTAILDGTDCYAKLSPLFVGGWVSSWLLTRGLAGSGERAGTCRLRSSAADTE